MYVCIYLYMSVTHRNTNFLYAACAGSMSCARGRTIVVRGPQCTNARVGRICTMDNRPLPRMKVIVCRDDQGTTCSPESLRSQHPVGSTPLLDVYRYQARCACARLTEYYSSCRIPVRCINYYNMVVTIQV